MIEHKLRYMLSKTISEDKMARGHLFLLFKILFKMNFSDKQSL